MVIENIRIKYATLNDTDDNGKFKVIFTFDNDKECKKLKKKIDEYWEENKPKGVKKPRHLPYFISEPSEEYPDDKDAGRLIFIASKNEKSKDGKDLGGVPVYQPDGYEYDEIPNIGSGTIANIIVDLFIWTFKKDAGVSMWLNKLQVIDLKEYSGGESFDNEKGKKKFDDDDEGNEKPKKKKKKKK